ncbi:hypothetical protein JCM6882_003695 [Rhodosporidiobolus microsporus]
MSTEYKEYVPPRDFVAYGEETPADCWPEGKKIVVSFVLNYEEGAEHTLWNDAGAPNAHSEQFLNETAYHRPGRPGKRDLYVESMYEYGTRAGLPRLLKLFKEFGWGWSTWTNARALEASAYYGKYLVDGGHDIACHGNRWITQTELYEEKPQVALLTGKPGPEEEAAHVSQAIDRLRAATGLQNVPTGWYYGRGSLYNKHILERVHREKGVPLLYTSDTYADDVPYYTESPFALDGEEDKGLLNIPYSLTNNDHRFYIRGAGFGNADDFFDLLKAEFDYMLEEGIEGRPKMMTIALHSRIIGRPGRIRALKRFMQYVKEHEDQAWVTTRDKIAHHWREKYPYQGATRLLHAEKAV